MKKLILVFILIMVFVSLIVIGIFKNEIIEVTRNATVLCLSCMGIG